MSGVAAQLDDATPTGGVLMEVSAQLFTIREAAVLLHVPEGWLRKKVSAQSVPHTRLGKHVRFTSEHLRQIVAKGESHVTPSLAASSGVSKRARRGPAGVRQREAA